MFSKVIDLKAPYIILSENKSLVYDHVLLKSQDENLFFSRNPYNYRNPFVLAKGSQEIWDLYNERFLPDFGTKSITTIFNEEFGTTYSGVREIARLYCAKDIRAKSFTAFLGNWLAEFFISLKDKHYYKLYIPWTEQERNRFDSVKHLVLGGGVLQGSFGQEVISIANQILAKKGYRQATILLSPYQRYLNIIGLSNFVSIESINNHKDASIPVIAIDVGQTAIKSGLVFVNKTSGKYSDDLPVLTKTYSRPDQVKNPYDLPQDTPLADLIKMREYLFDYLIDIIVDWIKYYENIHQEIPHNINFAVPGEINTLGYIVSKTFLPALEIMDYLFSEVMECKLRKKLYELYLDKELKDNYSSDPFYIKHNNDAVVGGSVHLFANTATFTIGTGLGMGMYVNMPD